MRTVFAHDHIFLRDPNGGYRSQKIPYALQERRYLKVFDEVRVVARCRAAEGADLQASKMASGPGVKIFPVPSLSSPTRRIVNLPKVVKTLRRQLEDADCLIARLPSEIGEVAVGVAEKIGRPALIEMVACAWDSLWNYGGLIAKAYAPVSYWRNRRILRRAKYVIYVTQAFLQSRYPTRGKSVGISDVDIEVRSSGLPRGAVRETRAEGDGLRIGFVGNLLRYKGIDTALRAAALLRRKGMRFHMYFVGSGDAEPWKRLSQRLRVAGICTFCGALPSHEHVLQWLDGIDIYIQPSRMEGLPRATVEAMSRALPVIASCAGGLPELLPRENLHRPGDYKGMASLLERMITDGAWRAACGARNVQRAMAYRRERLDAQWLRFMRDFLANAVAPTPAPSP